MWERLLCELTDGGDQSRAASRASWLGQAGGRTACAVESAEVLAPCGCWDIDLGPYLVRSRIMFKFANTLL